MIIATFLAGSLLSMLMPVLLLITLASLIFRAVRRIPGGDPTVAPRATKAEHSAPAGTPESSLRPPSGDPPIREV